MNIIEQIKIQAQSHPYKTALIIEDKVISYQDLMEETRQWSWGLSQLGVTQGERIALLLDNELSFAFALLAAADLGAVVVPLNKSLRPEAILTALDNVGCKWIIGHASSLQVLKISFPTKTITYISIENILNEMVALPTLLSSVPKEYQLGMNPGLSTQPYILTMTSGSTGQPKPIILSQETKLLRAENARHLYHLDASDTILAATPLYHSLAERLLLLPLLLGATAVIMPRFTPARWISTCLQHEVTFTIAVSSQLMSILTHLKEFPASLPKLKTIVSSSAPLKKEDKSSLINYLSCDFHECYGTSEIGIASNLTSDDAIDHCASVGRAVSGVNIKIVDEKGVPVPANIMGEILCRSETRFDGYFNNPSATAAAHDPEGYFRTGDMGYLDKEGFLYYSERKKDIIITGGINVYPKDIESVLMQCSEVKECAVIGVPDIRFGEAILAVIVPSEPSFHNERPLRMICLAKLADFQQPMAFEFIKELPRNSMGKLMRRELEKMFEGYDATARLRRLLR